MIVMEVHELSASTKSFWNELQLRALVMLSLMLQIILILLGNRRKYIDKIWIKIVVRSAYLSADSVATAALGILVSNLFRSGGKLDINLNLQAFWAPFLLLHLGGPDTITAYIFEDNELWRRHLLQLIVQTGFVFYVLLLGWTGSQISILTIPMILVGLIKYGERTWALWSASGYRQRRSLKPISQNMLQALFDGEDHSDDKLLQVAYGMLNMAKHLFAGVPIPATKQSATTRGEKFNFLQTISPKKAFEVIEMQLGFMYDLLYTKALVTYTPCGIALRFTSFLLTIIVTIAVLVLFHLAPHNGVRYSTVDVYITLLLLAVAILLELYAAIILLLSDQTVVWLRKQNRSNISLAITSLPLPRNPRWSNSMGQFSLLSFLDEIHMDSGGNLKLSKIKAKLGKQQHVAYRQVPEDLKIWLISRSRIYRERLEADPSYTTQKLILKNFGAFVTLGHFGYDPSGILFSVTRRDFQQAVIVWHIATELLYHLDGYYFTQGMAKNSTVALNRKMSKRISRYMMYLLAISPDSLPGSEGIGLTNLPGSEGIGLTNFPHTWDEARRGLVESFKPEIGLSTEKERKRKIKIQASKWLLEQYGHLIDLHDIKNDQLNGSLLSYGCAVADKLVEDKPGGRERELDGTEEQHVSRKWEILAGVWVELLIKAGKQCKAGQHAHHLRQGGQFMTHFWLLFSELEYLDELVTKPTADNV